jgi:fucose 4-O-acetylase-like acetyltransferase
VALFWIGAVLFCLTPAAWYVMDVREWAPTWLVELGQAAMILYFVHQIIVFTIVKQWLGVAFHSWLSYWVANIALMICLLYFGKAWLWPRPRLRRQPAPESQTAAATAGGR